MPGTTPCAVSALLHHAGAPDAPSASCPVLSLFFRFLLDPCHPFAGRRTAALEQTASRSAPSMALPARADVVPRDNSASNPTATIPRIPPRHPCGPACTYGPHSECHGGAPLLCTGLTRYSTRVPRHDTDKPRTLRQARPTTTSSWVPVLPVAYGPTGSAPARGAACCWWKRAGATTPCGSASRSATCTASAYYTEADPGLNGRRLRYPRGKVLGDCSSINGMIYMRDQARDCAQWAPSSATTRPELGAVPALLPAPRGPLARRQRDACRPELRP
jgi:hypothetical protein